MSDYRKEAREGAVQMVEEFIDDIVEQLRDMGEASDDYNNEYSDSYHHESFVDRSYSTREAVDVLEELDDFEETDSGLWEGQDFRTALQTCAAFTFGHAVGSFFSDLIKEINEDDDIAELYEQLQALDNEDDEDEDDEDADEPLTADQIEAKMKERIEHLCKNFV